MSIQSRERQHLRDLKRRIARGELRLPTREEVAVKLQAWSETKSEWAGFPMLVEGFPLVLEPRYPYQLRMEKKPDPPGPGEESSAGYEVVNSWFNARLGTTIQVLRKDDNIRAGIVVGVNKLTMLIGTLGASQAWLPAAEMKAQQKLAALITEWAMQCYLMTGMFLERSKRSGVTYLFRRLRPTIAMSAGHNEMKGLCALCRHSIGYYEGTHAGAMTPTDDVIAALVWMRGDEHKFWQGCNQHPLHYPQAAV